MTIWRPSIINRKKLNKKYSSIRKMTNQNIIWSKQSVVIFLRHHGSINCLGTKSC